MVSDENFCLHEVKELVKVTMPKVTVMMLEENASLYMARKLERNSVPTESREEYVLMSAGGSRRVVGRVRIKSQ